MTKHLVYKTTNLVNGKFYIGVHSCNCKSCSYLGSGVALKKAIEKYGQENFSRQTLRVFDSRQEAFKYERAIVDKDDSQSYNCAPGGTGKLGNPKNSRSKPITIEGVSYPSIGEAARALGTYHLKAKKLADNSWKPVGVHQAIPCEIKGIQFNSRRQAARYFGVTHKTISSWLLKAEWD